MRFLAPPLFFTDRRLTDRRLTDRRLTDRRLTDRRLTDRRLTDRFLETLLRFLAMDPPLVRSISYRSM